MMNKTAQHVWYIIDASGQPLGRLSSRIAFLLQGKHKPEYEAHHDHGDHVVVVNAGELKIGGTKYESKKYYHHSRYPGGLKQKTFRELFEESPPKVVWKSIYGMLPRNTLRTARMKRLHIYKSTTHPHKNITFVNAEK